MSTSSRTTMVCLIIIQQTLRCSCSSASLLPAPHTLNYVGPNLRFFHRRAGKCSAIFFTTIIRKPLVGYFDISFFFAFLAQATDSQYATCRGDAIMYSVYLFLSLMSQKRYTPFSCMLHRPEVLQRYRVCSWELVCRTSCRYQLMPFHLS